VIVERGEVLIVVETRRLVCLVELLRFDLDMVDVVGTQKLECLDENPVDAEVVTSPARGLVDVEVGNGILAVPAGPCCAAALPATDAVVVVLYMLVVPVCRPALLVLEWVSFVPGGGMSCVDPGRVLVGGLFEDHFVAVWGQEKVGG
jgi:hypothetical protein